MSSRFHKHFKQREKNVFQSLNDFDASPDKDSMHHFRVELKKLKALIRFLHETDNKHKLNKASKKLESIFKAAGEIREYQLILQWLRENNFTSIEKEFYPEENLNKLCNYFHSCIDEYKNNLDKVMKICDENVTDIHEKTEEKYIDDLNLMIEEKLSENLPTSEWHELRKIIKRWKYALDG